MELLQRQTDELQAAQAIFPEEFSFSPMEQQLYHMAREIVDKGIGDDAVADLGALSGSVRIPDVLINGAPVRLRFVLGSQYPDQGPARLSVECSASRTDHDELAAALQQCQEECRGSECLLIAIDALKQAAGAIQERQSRSAQSAASDSKNTSRASAPSACAVVWFHHIKSLEKRKVIVAQARELDIRGYCKPGFPGIIVAEGPEDALEDYLAAIRGLRWQAMQVRAQERVQHEPAAAGASATTGGAGRAASSIHEAGGSAEGAAQAGAGQAAPSTSAGSGSEPSARSGSAAGSRCFQGPFQELPEAGMSELSLACSAAGLEHLFLAALKISR